jgi:hypothetical protein
MNIYQHTIRIHINALFLFFILQISDDGLIQTETGSHEKKISRVRLRTCLLPFIDFKTQKDAVY